MNFLADWLIARAKRTPYFDLPGYMTRNWLIPYEKVTERRVTYVDYQQKGIDFEGDPIVYEEIVTDGTGPVGWNRPIAKIIQKLGLAVRIHEILRSDDGRDPHDHRWPFLTVILKGGYFETLYNDKGDILSTKWHGPGSILYRPAGTWHRLDVKPGEIATTLFVTGKGRGDWGFLVNGQKQNYWEYLGIPRKGD